jgi:hypothetical protein
LYESGLPHIKKAARKNNKKQKKNKFIESAENTDKENKRNQRNPLSWERGIGGPSGSDRDFIRQKKQKKGVIQALRSLTNVWGDGQSKSR